LEGFSSPKRLLKMANTNLQLVQNVERLADAVARKMSLEIVEVEIKGAGNQRVVRVTIDKEGSEVKGAGVTHDECETLSRQLSEALDADLALADEQAYTLEVTSPGIERKLLSVRDFSRFKGHQAKIRFRESVSGQRTWIGELAGIESESAAEWILLQVGADQPLKFRLEQVSQANLKHVW
jgi:ribosome maturation factor RimP